jgi:transcriptional regulator with XRE-family HTH domain
MEEIIADETLVEHLATEDVPFHFTDSGLDNVFLVGIKYFTSSSGKVVTEIPAANQLMSNIARNLVLSSTSLRGQEIRFLRKRLGKKGTDYAQLLRINGETLSRIENEKQVASDQLDSLVRMSYLLLSGDPQLAEHATKLAELITAEITRGETKIIMRISPQQEWSGPKAA